MYNPYGLCQDPRCKYKKMKTLLYPHSTELYWPSRFAETGEKSYVACNDCVNEDHDDFDRLGKQGVITKNSQK